MVFLRWSWNLWFEWEVFEVVRVLIGLELKLSSETISVVGFDTIELELDSIMSAIKEDNTKNQKRNGHNEKVKQGNGET